MKKTGTSWERCSVCGRLLTTEERLLNAIFGKDQQLCYNCGMEQLTPKCIECGRPTSLSLNGIPRCREHMDKDLQ